MKVRPNSFHWNGHTLGFHPQLFDIGLYQQVNRTSAYESIAHKLSFELSIRLTAYVASDRALLEKPTEPEHCRQFLVQAHNCCYGYLQFGLLCSSEELDYRTR